MVKKLSRPRSDRKVSRLRAEIQRSEMPKTSILPGLGPRVLFLTLRLRPSATELIPSLRNGQLTWTLATVNVEFLSRDFVAEPFIDMTTGS